MPSRRWILKSLISSDNPPKISRNYAYYTNVWTINQSKSLPGFRVAMASLDGIKRPVDSDVAERRKRLEAIGWNSGYLYRLLQLFTHPTKSANRECFFLSLKRQVNSNPATCSYIPKDHEKKSSTVSHWLKVLTTVTCHKFSLTDYRLPAAFFLAID